MKDFDPQPGEIYSFATTPVTEFSPRETGRYAAFKVLGKVPGYKGEDRVFAVLAGIWQEPPTFDQTLRSEILISLDFDGKQRPNVSRVTDDRLATESLAEIELLGSQPITDDEQRLVDGVRSWSPLHFVNSAAERNWRMAHDPEAYLAEVELKLARDVERYNAHQRRIRERLRKLTFEQLLSEIPFSKWNGPTSYPPADFTIAARHKVHDACRELMALGPKPRKPDVRRVLKKTVEWFNDIDSANGGVIETDEREDIFAALEELAYAAKQKSLAQEIDDWREW